MKGLLLSVYRSPRIGDCTNGGISSGADQVVVVGLIRGGQFEPLPRRSQVFEPGDDAPAVVLVESRLPKQYGPHLEPAGERAPGMVGPMSGGHYAGSSDSRWSELGDLFGHSRLGLVSIHDRFESSEQYARLSSD